MVYNPDHGIHEVTYLFSALSDKPPDRVKIEGENCWTCHRSSSRETAPDILGPNKRTMLHGRIVEQTDAVAHGSLGTQDGRIFQLRTANIPQASRINSDHASVCVSIASHNCRDGFIRTVHLHGCSSDL